MHVGLETFLAGVCRRSRSHEMVHEIECSIWSEGELEKDKERMSIYDVRKLLVFQGGMKKLSHIFADGCAPSLNLEDFEGVVIVAASPSASTNTLRKQIMHPTSSNI